MSLINPLRLFTRPEYLFRPTQVVHRFRRLLSAPPEGEFVTVVLPWGARLQVHPKEVIGASIWCYGIFDLIVAEAIARLVDPAEVTLDIGANIGQMTSLMRHRAGPAGRVVAFEPHPTVFVELEFNMKTGTTTTRLAPVVLHNFALSETDGVAHLDVGEGWEDNRGLARVVADGTSPRHRTSQIQIKRLDSVLTADTAVGVCKIDVEGHELNVLKGARGLLAERRIRDIIFEDWSGYPSPIHRHLLQAGFTLFGLHLSLLRPSLHPAEETNGLKQAAEVSNYLATLDPQRALARFRPQGWLALRKA